MADIVMRIPDVAGESTKAGYEGEIDCNIIRETLEVQRGGNTRRARHSDIELTRQRDRATPHLAYACSSGEVYNSVQILILNTGGTPLFSYTLRDVVVSKIEHETLDSFGTAYLPHSPAGVAAPPNAVSPNPTSGAGALAAQVLGLGNQLVPRPYYTAGYTDFSQVEIERVWLNAGSVVWSYNSAAGMVENAWNILAGASMG